MIACRLFQMIGSNGKRAEGDAERRRPMMPCVEVFTALLIGVVLAIALIAWIEKD